MPSTIWVTGASGFTGRHLVGQLKSRYPDALLVALSRHPRQLEGVGLSPAIDVNDGDAVQNLAQRHPPAWVFHLAGLMPPADEASMWHTNVGGTFSVMSALYRAGIRDVRFLSIGSAAEYSQKEGGFYTEEDLAIGYTPYGKLKSAQTLLALKTAELCPVNVIIARPFNLLGPGLSTNLVAGKLCAELKGLPEDDGAITLGNIHSERDFLDVRDAVQAYCLLMERGEAGRTYNVCSGEATSIQDLVATASALLNKSPAINVDSDLLRARDPDRVQGCNRRIVAETEWKPAISVAESLRDMLAG